MAGICSSADLNFIGMVLYLLASHLRRARTHRGLFSVGTVRRWLRPKAFFLVFRCQCCSFCPPSRQSAGRPLPHCRTLTTHADNGSTSLKALFLSASHDPSPDPRCCLVMFNPPPRPASPILWPPALGSESGRPAACVSSRPAAYNHALVSLLSSFCSLSLALLLELKRPTSHACIFSAASTV